MHININNLRFSYKQGFRFKVNSFLLNSGERLFIHGDSGTGKSTFLKLITGIEYPEEGDINFDDVRFNRLTDAKQRSFRLNNIGLIFQDLELIKGLNVLDNILLPCLINPQLKLSPQLKQRASELAEQAGLHDYLKRKPESLSQGEQQRLAVCRALLVSPKLIIADEPTANLDMTNKAIIMKMLVDYSKNNAASLMVVSHDESHMDLFTQHLHFPLKEDL